METETDMMPESELESGAEANSTSIQRVTHENPPPRVWRIPTGLRRRLSNRVGRQRAISEDGHLVLVLHQVPKRRTLSSATNRESRMPGVYFWRSPEGEWFHSEQGSGFSSLEQLVADYEEQTVELETLHEDATNNEHWFEILDSIVPLARAARNLLETLQQAREQTKDLAQRAKLQPLCDQASEIEHAAELLQMDVQNSIQYSMARQAELQADMVREQSNAAHRLNILAAIFLPTATLSSLFGMNLNSGMEQLPPHLFWSIVLAGIALGAVIGIFVMRMKGMNPNTW